MRVISKIVIDMSTMEVVEIISHEYKGPISLCCGEGGGGEGSAPDEGSAFGGQDPSDFGGMGPQPSGIDTSFLASDESSFLSDDTVAEAKTNLARVDEEIAKAKTARIARWISSIGKVGYALVAGATALIGLPIAGAGMALASPIASNAIDEFAADFAQTLANNPNMTPSEAVDVAFERGDFVGPDGVGGLDAPGTKEAIKEYVVKAMGDKNPVPPPSKPITLGPGGFRDPPENREGDVVVNNVVKTYDQPEYISDRETALLDEMEANEIAKFTKRVMERSNEINQTAIASLVNRGVLQGTVGENVLSRLNKETMETIGEGTADIQTQRMASEMGLIAQGRDLALKSEALDWSKERFGEELDWTKQQWAENLAWDKQRWAEDVNLQRDLGKDRAEAIKDANEWTAFGNFTGGAMAGLWGSGGTDWTDYFD
jgi:hypothetical protein